MQPDSPCWRLWTAGGYWVGMAQKLDLPIFDIMFIIGLNHNLAIRSIRRLGTVTHEERFDRDTAGVRGEDSRRIDQMSVPL